MNQVLEALADFYNEDPEAFELPPTESSTAKGRLYINKLIDIADDSALKSDDEWGWPNLVSEIVRGLLEPQYYEEIGKLLK
jgi:hypothetical protein